MTIQTEKQGDPLTVEFASQLEAVRKKELSKASTTARVRPDIHAPLRDLLVMEKAFPDGGAPDIDVIQNHLLREGRLHGDVARALLAACERLLRKEPNVLSLKAPITVCGDVHGQFYDLIALFNTNGRPTKAVSGDHIQCGHTTCRLSTCD